MGHAAACLQDTQTAAVLAAVDILSLDIKLFTGSEDKKLYKFFPNLSLPLHNCCFLLNAIAIAQVGMQFWPPHNALHTCTASYSYV